MRYDKGVRLLNDMLKSLSVQKNEGSTFWFTAALAWDQAGVDPVPDTPAAAAANPLEAIAGARVLLVEDNAFNQEVAVDFLERKGAIVTTAGNGREAVDMFARSDFDCVLMDLQMPIMDGLEATRRIRALPRGHATPILAMTANAGTQDRDRCFDAGMDDFLTKPIQPALFYATLARWLSTRRAPKAAAQGRRTIDWDVLSEATAGDADKLHRYADLFAQTMGDTVRELDAALRVQDLDTVAALGHRLKSSARMVGALGIATACESLENFKHTGDLDGARAQGVQLSRMFQEVRADMDSVMAHDAREIN